MSKESHGDTVIARVLRGAKKRGFVEEETISLALGEMGFDEEFEKNLYDALRKKGVRIVEDSPDEDIRPKEPNPSDSTSMYLMEVSQFPLLSKQEEYNIFSRIRAGGKDGDAAKQQMIESNLRLVIHIAKQYSYDHLPLLDIIQEGNIGLMTAIDKFDHTRGLKFSTYAYWWIRRGVRKSFTQARAIRMPGHIQFDAERVRVAMKKFFEEYGYEPSLSELKIIVKLPDKKLNDILKILREPLSLEYSRQERKKSTFGDTVLDKTSPDAADVINNKLLAEQFKELLGDLKPQEKDVLIYRYGLDGHKPRSLALIGEIYGVSKERIRQVEKSALRKLRHPSMSSQILDFADGIPETIAENIRQSAEAHQADTEPEIAQDEELDKIVFHA